jgi:N-acyl-D-amino-acid deacylase
MFDVIIKNGMIVDGTRQPRFKGDIGIRNGVIAEFGDIDAAASPQAEIIEADGLIVAPGFIDLHTHYDSQLFWDPYCSISGWHGVTSVVIGNCGFGFAPMKPEMRDRSMLSMTRIEAIPLRSMQLGMPWDWVTFPEFLDSVDRAPKSINILPYVPAGPLLVWVLGFEDAKSGRLPTVEEHAEIRRLFNEALDAGGCGWSAQRQTPDGPGNQRDYDGTPMVTDVMRDETCRELAKVLRKRNMGFIQITQMSSNPEADRRIVEELAEISGQPVIMNTVVPIGDRPNKHRQDMAWLNGCRERGIRVIGQGATVAAGFTFRMDEWNLFDDVEAWKEVTTGTFEERKAKMGDPARRETLKAKLPGLFRDIVLTGPRLDENKQWIDHTLSLIAEKTGRHPVDIMLDISVEEDLQTEFYAALKCPDELMKEVIDDPYVLLGLSDGGAHTRFFTGGRYPTETIVEFVRKNGWITLEEVHWRLSALPAQVAGFRGRGTLQLGAPADIVVYDFENLEVLPDEIFHDQPGDEWRRVQRASGYRYVLVNGEVTIRDDKETHVYSGQLLRHGEGKRAPLEVAA